MSDPQHPDIEIYIKHADQAAIMAWLGKISDELSTISQKGDICQLSMLVAGHSIPVLIHQRVLGKAWTSLWFQSDKTPWKIDLDCAKAASEALETQVRCITAGWSEGEEADEWWKLEKGVCEKILWKNDHS